MEIERENKESEGIQQRFCWGCENHLDFLDLCNTNPDLNIEQLKALWQNPHLQFYCCKCFNDELRRIRQERREK